MIDDVKVSDASAFGKMVRCEIHPGIGIARVGNSESADGWFIGPELPGEVVVPDGGYKDAKGRMKRQAARFRIYAFDKDGNNLGELPVVDPKGAAVPAGYKVVWTVHLANKKAAAHEFTAYHPGTDLRNAAEINRAGLVIDPGARSIGGHGVAGKEHHFDDGCFRGKPVPLGELRTDPQGRLLVLGGFGTSAAVVPGEANPDSPTQDYANNDDWHDDVSDGPVTATVTLTSGKDIPVEAAWVIVAPPNFAPAVNSIVTLYDVIRDTAVRAGRLADYPGKVNYYRDIYPILLRAADTAWVNNDARLGHGFGKRGDYRAKDPGTPDGKSKKMKFDAGFLTSEIMSAPAAVNPFAAVAGKSEPDIRTRIFSRLREPLDFKETPAMPGEQVLPVKPGQNDPRHLQATAQYMPQLSGDRGDAREGNPFTWLTLLRSQYDRFQAWAAGAFDTGTPPQPLVWDKLSASEQTEALQRAALEPCVGGAFFPGIEMTYLARWKKTFSAAFRIDQKSHSAGDITQYMAVPWQADFNDCNTNWWPAQRPDDVISKEAFDEANEAWTAGKDVPKVSEALEGRAKWDRGLGANTLFRRAWQNPATVLDDPEQAAVFARDDMIRYWSELGIVSPLRAKSGEVLQVEVERRPYAGMDARLLFHGLLNLTVHGGCRPKAREYVERVLAAAREVQKSPTAFQFMDNFRPFRYDEEAFQARMMDIYDDCADFAFFARNGGPEPYDPDSTKHNPDFRSLESVTERIRQLTPFNFLDGAWLRNIHRVGPVDEVNSILFYISKEELGDGIPSQNHANIYRDLCHSFGFYPPPVASSAFAFDRRFLDAAFDSATFQLAISEFTEEYYPEIIGMSLWLEWAVLDLHRIAGIVERVGLNPHFYRMHIAIDNAENGHGARIIRAVKLYLQQVRQAGGDRAMQCQWERIWNGYVAFSYTFSVLIGQLKWVIRHEKQAKENRLDWLQGRLERLIRQKKAFGRHNHGERLLGSRRLNEWFDDPANFLEELIKQNWIKAGKPDESPFFQLLAFEGGRRHRDLAKDDKSDGNVAKTEGSKEVPQVEFEGGRMYSIFTPEEIQLWRDWTVEKGKKKPELAAARATRLLATANAAVAGNTAIGASGNLDQAASDPRIALWLEMAEDVAGGQRAASPGMEMAMLSASKANVIGDRAKMWLGWSMIRAINHIGWQKWTEAETDSLTLSDAAGQPRTSAGWIGRVRDATNATEAARDFLMALKTEFEKQKLAPAAIVDALKTSPLWTKAWDLVVPGNDGKRVGDTVQVWVANGFPLPDLPQGPLTPLRLDSTLDEEEHHPTGVALGFGTMH